MKTVLFRYNLPENLIAQEPLSNREDSKLLVCNSNTKTIIDKNFNNLPNILSDIYQSKENNSRILLIGNNSKVYPARVRIKRKSGARGEVFFLEQGNKTSYHCLLRPTNKLKIGEILYLDSDENLPLFVVEKFDPPMVSILNDVSLDFILEKYGEMPLPPYIVRNSLNNNSKLKMDKERYQTVYSNVNQQGSCAAPTAGLHFTPQIINECASLNIDICYVTLHVGLGTFLPVKSEDIENHNIHEEQYLILPETIQKIVTFIENDWPIVFIGTTSMRTIESFFRKYIPNCDKSTIIKMAKNKQLLPFLNDFTYKWIATNIFIYPKTQDQIYTPIIGNGIITNFHQSESTLVMLVSALIGYDFWKEIYTHAIEKKYRFLSYGDSSLLVFGENS